MTVVYRVLSICLSLVYFMMHIKENVKRILKKYTCVWIILLCILYSFSMMTIFFTQINQDEFSYIKPRDIDEARLVRIEHFDGTYLYN